VDHVSSVIALASWKAPGLNLVAIQGGMIMNRRTFLQAAGLSVVSAGVGMTRSGWTFHKSDLPTIQPSYGDIENSRSSATTT
jgi:hypothetical protein